VAQSMERLLAKAVLREKAAEMRGRVEPRRPRRRGAAMTAVAAGLLVAAFLYLAHIRWSYPSPHIEGDFQVVGAAQAEAPSATLRRGDRIVVRDGGARLSLGGYCDLEVEPDSELMVAGSPGKEVIELVAGHVSSQVTPQKGGFRVNTILGAIDVVGTRFLTTVDSPRAKGGQPMSASTRKLLTVVTVSVMAGVVSYDFDDGTGRLTVGMTKTFGGESGSSAGAVVSTTDLSVTLKAANGAKTTFHTGQRNKMAVHEISQLNAGEQVTVSWVAEEGKKWVKDISGSGTIVGTVTAKGEKWIKVKPDGGREQKFVPPWHGGMPAQGGGLDKEVLRKIAATKVGANVVLKWEMPEGKRVVDIELTE